MRILPLALVLAAVTAAPAQAETAGATGWTLISVGGDAAEPGGRIAFSADGAIFGTTGCNRFNGSAVSAPGLVTFRAPLATTKMACPGALEAQEAKVLEALDGAAAVAYDPVRDMMTLIPGSGAPVLGFARAVE